MLILKNEPYMYVYNKQYPVGQGGLHLSIITVRCNNSDRSKKTRKYKRYAYIYDCGDFSGGSATYINRVMNELISDMKKCHFLDYHFCDCHPLFSCPWWFDCDSQPDWCSNFPIDYLYIFISHLHQDHYNGLVSLKERLEEERLDKEKIYKNKPILILPYMCDMEKEIIIGENSDNENFHDFINDPEGFLDNKFDVYYLTDDEKYYTPDSNNNNNPCSPDICDFDYTQDGYEKKIIHHEKILRFGSWVLRMFYNGIPEEQLKDLKNKVNCDFKDISPEQMEKNKKCYQQKFKDLNLSSLCLYSGPQADILGEGFMHTGDIELNKKVLKNFKKHYKRYLQNVCVAQIPHHGSQKNSSLDTFRIFPNLKLLYITKEIRTNGRRSPHIREEYKDKTFIKKVTTQQNTALTFHNKDALSYLFVYQKPIFNKVEGKKND